MKSKISGSKGKLKEEKSENIGELNKLKLVSHHISVFFKLNLQVQ
jgi:hypothetical protein